MGIYDEWCPLVEFTYFNRKCWNLVLKRYSRELSGAFETSDQQFRVSVNGVVCCHSRSHRRFCTRLSERDSTAPGSRGQRLPEGVSGSTSCCFELPKGDHSPFFCKHMVAS